MITPQNVTRVAITSLSISRAVVYVATLNIQITYASPLLPLSPFIIFLSPSLLTLFLHFFFLLTGIYQCIWIMCEQHFDHCGLLLVLHSLYYLGDLEDVCWLLKPTVSIIDEEKRGEESVGIAERVERESRI